MDFLEATDALLARGIGLPELAKALGIAYTTIRAARLDPDSTSYRRPPAGWRRVVARLARERSRGLAQLADQLEREAAT